ncbi:hypothetical protein [Parasitella parasitica]|uniref:Pentacotripeptide-repeat region of PRORP domain-containing protein n=1 Tax=Parasitella parasitica TaxID=35722 RepID=A0A0B7N936_9FUNG|nr:hypothetical protein [Parasitella parasitica]
MATAAMDKTPTATVLPVPIPPAPARKHHHHHHQHHYHHPPSRLHDALRFFNLSERLTLADLSYAIQLRNADQAWSIFVTLASRHDNDTIPMTLCCSLYALLNFAKKLTGFSNKASKLRQKQLDQLLAYVEYHQSSTELFLSSVKEIPISNHKQLLKAIRTGDYHGAWTMFYRLHKESKKSTMDQFKLPRNTCIQLMIMIMKDKRLDRNQLNSKLQLIALHGSGVSEYDSRYLSAADLGRLAYICRGYQKNATAAHGLIDEFVMGLPKKKQSNRADALDELIWRILVNGDLHKAGQVLKTVQQSMADKVPVNEMVFVNLMDAYGRQGKHHESLEIFEQFLQTKQQPTIKSFNAVLQIFAAQGSADRAGFIFETMNQLDVEPDAATYTEMIRAHGRAGQMKMCIHFYNKMLQSHIPPNVYTYSALIEASSRRNDIKSVFRWFQIMISDNVQPNQVVLSCILKSLSKQHNDYPNMPEAVLHIAHQAAMAGVKTDAALYTILLKMQAESIGLDGALKVHRDMLTQSVEPNTYTYTILIDACGKNKMPETAEKIFDLMKQSQRHRPNTVTYSAMMDAWLKTNRRDKVESLILEFLQECKSDKTGRFWLDSRICNRIKSRCC